MEKSSLYLAAYDISSPRRLRLALIVLRDYALGRQKSVFECPLEEHEVNEMVHRVEEVIDTEEDRFALIRLDRRCTSHVLGCGVPIETGNIFYLG